MSQFTSNNPNTGAFRVFKPGPHSGVDTDPDAQGAEGILDSRARNALVLGVLSLVLGVVTGIPALWVGGKALAHLHTAGAGPRDRSAAWTGIALGCVGIVGTVAVWFYFHQRG